MEATRIKVELLWTARSYVPSAIWENRKNLYLIEDRGNKVLVSTSPNPVGHVCAFVRKEDVLY